MQASAALPGLLPPTIAGGQLHVAGGVLDNLPVGVMKRFIGGTGSLAGRDLAALGIPSLPAYVDAYVARTGLDPRPHLPVYLAYNFFRIAAILQGIVGRVRDGTATNENAPARARLVRPLAAIGRRFAREAGAP
jgi:aminoglycoside phosphotransferase (APT) family kinase protein